MLACTFGALKAQDSKANSSSFHNNAAPDPNTERMRIVNEKIAREKADAAAKEAEKQRQAEAQRANAANQHPAGVRIQPKPSSTPAVK